jgi:glutamine amidotransferase PdxT
MFNLFNQKEKMQLYNLQGQIDEHSKLIKDIKEELEKVDIKAMEGLRSYRAKLKRLTGGEEKETETNKNPSVFLSPDGTFI